MATFAAEYPLAPNIEKEFDKYRNKLLLEKLKDANVITSIAKNCLSYFQGEFIPGFKYLKQFGEASNTRKMNWTGFISEIENIA